MHRIGVTGSARQWPGVSCHEGGHCRHDRFPGVTSEACKRAIDPLDGMFWSFSNSAASVGLLSFDQTWQNKKGRLTLELVAQKFKALAPSGLKSAQPGGHPQNGTDGRANFMARVG